MKIKNWLFAGLVVAILVAVVVPSSSMAGIHWNPVSDFSPTNAYAISVSPIPPDTGAGSMWLFDANGSTDDAIKVVTNVFLNTTTINFTKTGNIWKAGVGISEVELGLTPTFELLFSTANNDISNPDTDYSSNETSQNSYTLASSVADMNVSLINVQAVPISGTFWLFSFGFMGLVGLKRKFWKK